jgi:hypothetical protein
MFFSQLFQALDFCGEDF